jgi:hypothetical protein
MRRRSLRVSDDGLYVGGRPFRTLTAAWADIASITLTQTTARISTHAGKVRHLDLSDLDNAGDIRAALIAAQARVRPRTP